MERHNTMQVPQNNSIPVSEVYWSLVHKADKKFSKIRDLPFYYRNRQEYDAYFYKVFKVYTQVWKFQQENRQKLVDAGLKRWEIGEIASRIAQLYFGQYMKTSDASYLSESYVFYNAILTREYFKDGMFHDLSLANKQLRFISRFITVCLILNRRDMVQQLLNQLKLLLDDCKRTFQEADFKEWKLVVQELLRFLKADTPFLNLRPLRYSIVLDQPQPDSQILPYTKRNLRLRDAVLSSYHHNEVKFSELTLDTFRMLQCMEWEPSGSFYQSNATKNAQNGSPPSRTNYSHEISDPTLPPNPRKAVLYRPSVTHFLAVVATICEELPPDGVFLIYLSASGAGMCSGTTSLSPLGFLCDRPIPSSGESKGDSLSFHPGCLLFGTRGNRGINCIYPSDLVPFTRRPLFLVIDCDNSEVFEAISGAEKGETAAILLSPSTSYRSTTFDSSHHPSGSLFTIFLTAPLQAFCLLLGISGSDVEMDKYNKAEKLLSLSLNDWGLALVASDTLDPVWAQILGDPFLRRLLLRVIDTFAVKFDPNSIKIVVCGQNIPASMTELIGAKYFYDGLKKKNITKISMESARDTLGHRTVVSSRAAGNYVHGASNFGYAKGVAPRARLAVYKVAWQEGSMTSDVVAGVEAAIDDGVDVISISSSNLFKPSVNPLSASLFAAMEKGIVVSRSTGNVGPAIATVDNGHPWVTVTQTRSPPIVASRTSRGPLYEFGGHVKPDIVAPGTRVLGAWIPSKSSAQLGLNWVLYSDYNLRTGTSYASRHVAGVAALLKCVHPEWSPAAIRSAMMITAKSKDALLKPLRDGGNNLQVASPIAMGSGLVAPNLAVDPDAVVYKATMTSPLNFLVTVSPQTLAFASKGEKKSYTLAITYKGNDNITLFYGTLVGAQDQIGPGVIYETPKKLADPWQSVTSLVCPLQRKNQCYADIESGLWGQQCTSSMIAKENCALRCLSPACYELIYESDPLEEGEKDLVRGQEFKYCMHK
ncbi:hypothetical protein FNV43_RR12762 [Rhamnella rubrinervis]|uniref:Uncharacterized protein n=1 Tax=Rhamnella rubrinervis TaxID=2594499 RepID=A0A8K0MJ68_9ROSA|nr:hypothetical protein FNV43_RR12762 [Rhamnella rubrinervis]